MASHFYYLPKGTFEITIVRLAHFDWLNGLTLIG